MNRSIITSDLTPNRSVWVRTIRYDFNTWEYVCVRMLTRDLSVLRAQFERNKNKMRSFVELDRIRVKSPLQGLCHRL